MAKCEVCNKSVSFGIKISHSHRRSNKMWKPNLRRVRAIVDGAPKRIYVCTRCMRSGKVVRGYGSSLAKVAQNDIDIVDINAANAGEASEAATE